MFTLDDPLVSLVLAVAQIELENLTLGMYINNTGVIRKSSPKGGLAYVTWLPIDSLPSMWAFDVFVVWQPFQFGICMGSDGSITKQMHPGCLGLRV